MVIYFLVKELVSNSQVLIVMDDIIVKVRHCQFGKGLS